MGGSPHRARRSPPSGLRTNSDRGRPTADRGAATPGHGGTAPGGRDTVAAYRATWLAGLAGTVRPTTAEKDRRDLERHVVPRVGRLPLARLTPERLARLYGDLTAAGLAPMSVRHIHAELHRAPEQGVRRARSPATWRRWWIRLRPSAMRCGP